MKTIGIPCSDGKCNVFWFKDTFGMYHAMVFAIGEDVDPKHCQKCAYLIGATAQKIEGYSASEINFDPFSKRSAFEESSDGSGSEQDFKSRSNDKKCYIGRRRHSYH